MERRRRTKHSGRQKRPSAWPQRSDDRVRVLLEYPAHSTPSAMAKALDDAGYETLICEGTDRCPIVAGGDCALVDGADVVVSGFGVTTSNDRELPAAIRSRHPELPLVVECTEPTSERYPDLVGPSIHLRNTGLEVVRHRRRERCSRRTHDASLLLRTTGDDVQVTESVPRTPWLG